MKAIYKRIGKLFSTYSIGNAAQKALFIVLIPLYTSVLSPADYGILALMTLTASLMTRTVSSPINHALRRFYYKPEYKSRNGLLLFNLFVLLGVKTCVLVLIYWAMTPALCQLLFSDQTLAPVVYLYSGVILLTPASNFLLQFLRLKEMARLYVLLSLGQLILSTGVILHGLFVLKIGIYAPILGTITGVGCITLFTLPVFVREAAFTLSLPLLKEPLKYAYPQLITGYSNLLIESGDRYVLRIFDSLSSVGLYSFGYQVALIIRVLIVTPLQYGLQPVLFQLEAKPQEQKRFLRSAATHYYLLGMFITLGLSLFSKETIMLLARKPGFWHAWVIVPVISFSYVQHGLKNFVEWGLIMKNKSYHIPGNLLFSAAINIGLNVVFIPLWGILGAAFATMISYIVWNGLTMYYSAKFYDLHFELAQLTHISAVGIGLYLLSLVVMAAVPNLFMNITIKLLLLLSYPVLFFLTGFFSELEKAFMRKLWIRLRNLCKFNKVNNLI